MTPFRLPVQPPISPHVTAFPLYGEWTLLLRRAILVRWQRPYLAVSG